MTTGIPFTAEETDALKKKVLEYFIKTPGGTFAGACKYTNIGYSTGYEWRAADAEFNKNVIAARNAADDLGGDFAESKLMEAINNNELTGIIFYLKTKHKNRGYVERQENETRHTGEVSIGGNDIEILKRFFTKKQNLLGVTHEEPATE